MIARTWSNKTGKSVYLFIFLIEIIKKIIYLFIFLIAIIRKTDENYHLLVRQPTME